MWVLMMADLKECQLSSLRIYVSRPREHRPGTRKSCGSEAPGSRKLEHSGEQLNKLRVRLRPAFRKTNDTPPLGPVIWISHAAGHRIPSIPLPSILTHTLICFQVRAPRFSAKTQASNDIARKK